MKVDSGLVIVSHSTSRWDQLLPHFTVSSNAVTVLCRVNAVIVNLTSMSGYATNRPLERGFERIAISVAGVKGGDGSGWPFAILFLQSVGNSLLRFNQPPTMWQWRSVLAAYHL